MGILINRKDQISKHFHGDEFACPCCGVSMVDEDLLSALEAIHFLLDKPLHILSGYRCEAHNKEIGGEKNSQHCLGKAVDVRLPAGMFLKEFYNVANKLQRFGGIGVYPAGAGQVRGFLHLDVREKVAKWSRINGKYLPVQDGLDFASFDLGKH